MCSILHHNMKTLMLNEAIEIFNDMRVMKFGQDCHLVFAFLKNAFFSFFNWLKVTVNLTLISRFRIIKKKDKKKYIF